MFSFILAALLFTVRRSSTSEDLSQNSTQIIPPLTEGQQATLTCIALAFCSGSVPDITWVWGGRGKNDSHITGNITAFTTENVTAVTKTHSSTLTFYVSAEHNGTEFTYKVSFANNITTEETATLNVTHVWKLEISGNTTVKQGDTLNLTCSTDGNHSYVIKWANLSVNAKLKDKSGSDLQRATLFILNVTEKHSGQYVCKAEHQNNTLRVRVTVNWPPKILNSSGCINKSGILTCMCISQGTPIPTIKWPLLKNLSEYSVISTLSNHTVNSTVILAARDQSDTTVKCVSNNKNGDDKRKLDIQEVEEKKEVEEEEEEGQYMKWLRKATQLEVVIAFAIGVLLCAIICCFARKCPRKKPSTHGGVAENLEMVTAHSDPLVTNHEEPLVDAGQAQECDHAINQEVAEAGGAMAAENSDVNYSNLDFSLMKSPVGVTQSTAEADYAEIRKEKAEERQEEEEEDEDTALYSTVKDVMDGN